jgi:hypothetical protein
MSAKFKDWLTFENGIRLKKQNIIGYHKNNNENHTKVFVQSNSIEFFPVEETPDEIDVMLGKTVSTEGENDEK